MVKGTQSRSCMFDPPICTNDYFFVTHIEKWSSLNQSGKQGGGQVGPKGSQICQPLTNGADLVGVEVRWVDKNGMILKEAYPFGSIESRRG